MSDSIATVPASVRNLHLPMWLGSGGLPQAVAVASLFALDSLSRALLVTVVPLQAVALLGGAQPVSVLYFAVGAVGLCGSFAVPWLVHHIPRRFVLTIGSLSMSAAIAAMSMQSVPGIVVGLCLQALASACIEVSLNLYMMDHVPRREFNRFEPLRIFMAGGVWMVAPALGVYLAAALAGWAPFAVAAAAALTLLGYFWFLRLTDPATMPPASSSPPNPLRYLPRFVSQPRLRLAWTLAMGRNAWWAMFQIYTPIYAVAVGFDEVAAGLIVSAGFASILLVTVWGWFGRRYGLRYLLITGYLTAGIATFAVAFLAEAPWLGVALLIGAAIGGSIIDGGGNVLFLRAVHPHERPQMTTVYITYRYVSQMAPPGVFALILKLFSLSAVFAVSGATTAAMAALTRYIPKRM